MLLTTIVNKLFYYIRNVIIRDPFYAPSTNVYNSLIHERIHFPKSSASGDGKKGLPVIDQISDCN